MWLSAVVFYQCVDQDAAPGAASTRRSASRALWWAQPALRRETLVLRLTCMGGDSDVCNMPRITGTVDEEPRNSVSSQQRCRSSTTTPFRAVSQAVNSDLSQICSQAANYTSDVHFMVRPPLFIFVPSFRAPACALQLWRRLKETPGTSRTLLIIPKRAPQNRPEYSFFPPSVGNHREAPSAARLWASTHTLPPDRSGLSCMATISTCIL